MVDNKKLEQKIFDLAQKIAILTNAWTVHYDEKKETYSYYTEGQNILRLTKNHLREMVESNITNRKVK
jgi:hypothetical protein